MQVEARISPAEAGANRKLTAVETIRFALSMILKPAEAVKGALERVPWPVCLAVSGLAFTLFFLQTGLDRHHVRTAGAGWVVGFSFLGLAMGTAGVALLALMAWAAARPLGCERPFDWTMRAFGLAYTPTLIFAAVGILFNLAAGWNTAVAFGVTGVLWALYPILTVVREMTGDRLAASLAMTTVLGALILGAWALLGI